MADVPMKRCTKCGVEKPATLEYFREGRQGRLRNGCRECARVCSAAFHAKNKDYNATYDAAHQKERRAWAEAHPRNRSVYNASYSAAHREERRAREHKRRARKRGDNGTHAAADIRLQAKMQTDKRGRLHCWWCDKVIKGNDYHVDHRIPLAKGGSNAPENIVLAHAKCNLSKGAKMPAEFMGRLL